MRMLQFVALILYSYKLYLEHKYLRLGLYHLESV